MAEPEDDDPLPEWATPANTKTVADDRPPELLEEDKDTAPHRTLGAALAEGVEAVREAGYAKGMKDGQEDAIRALAEVFKESPGGYDESARHVVGRVRAKLTPV